MYNQSRIFIDYYNVRKKIERLRANAFISPGSRLSLLIDIEYQGTGDRTCEDCQALLRLDKDENDVGTFNWWFCKLKI